VYLLPLFTLKALVTPSVVLYLITSIECSP
jgi:hypothetical protein